MSTEDSDLYSILGVLPEAEHVVIVAAFRALAQRYHPDKWKGDPAEAHQRMAQLNAAYQVLSDSSSRQQYDHTRARNRQADFGNSEEKDAAFNSALLETEERWQIACTVFPDLSPLRARLQRVSAALAFAYVATLLATKHFAQREEMAVSMEQAFLERYFSSNPYVLEYARRLIAAGQREAAKSLNRLIDVVGVAALPQRLISQIDERYGLKAVWDAQEREKLHRTQRMNLVREAIKYVDFTPARKLAEFLGYTVNELPMGLFRTTEVSIISPLGEKSHFKNRDAFVRWVQNALCK